MEKLLEVMRSNKGFNIEGASQFLKVQCLLKSAHKELNSHETKLNKNLVGILTVHEKAPRCKKM